jgi:two-component system OmpR family response regulator
VINSAESPKVLIVDDEVDICFLLSNLLKKKNYQTQSAFDIHQAKLALANYNPSVVFLDNHLTDGLGMNFIPFIKKNYPSTKIIMITAYDDKESKQEAYSNGVDEFISKPLRWEILNNTMDKLLNNSTVPEV